jgi:hypothetical protein
VWNLLRCQAHNRCLQQIYCLSFTLDTVRTAAKWRGLVTWTTTTRRGVQYMSTHKCSYPGTSVKPVEPSCIYVCMYVCMCQKRR